MFIIWYNAVKSPSSVSGVFNYIFGFFYFNTLPRYEPIIVQEMLALIIQIVKERRFSGLSPSECLRRELVYKLSIGDATRSQLMKSLPSDLSKIDKLQEVLDSIAVYSNPSGMNQVCLSLGHYLTFAHCHVKSI